MWLVQFGGPLSDQDVRALQRRRIEILLPTVAGAFHARATHDDLAAARDFVPRILGWSRLRADDRLLPALAERDGGWPAYALAPDGGARRQLMLYPGADPKAVVLAVQDLGGAKSGALFGARGPGLLRLDVHGPPTLAFSLALAALPGVYAVDLPPPPKRVCNEDAALLSNINTVQAAPRNLTGAGVVVLVRDEGPVFAHPDLAGRLTLGPDVAALPSAQHSTHVAGAVGGTGAANVLARARGMATSCSIVSYDMQGDDLIEPLEARTTYGAVLSNHSYGFVTGWDSGTFTDNQSTFGVYGAFARDWDSLIQINSLIFIKSVGNDRNDTGVGHPHDGTLAADGEYYDTADQSSTGKNLLVVGASTDTASAGAPSAATAVTAISSSGPCDDGRLRPELIANGDLVNSTNNSAVPGSEYAVLSGASMACAVVTGATALLMESYQQRYGAGSVPAPHFVRAVYAQTAADFGRPGPDYLHGFGLLNTTAAVSQIESDSPPGIRNPSATLSSAAPERFYVLVSDGVTQIKATLCWTDAPGDVLAAKALVNDLDVRLIRPSDQAVFLPFTLNPALPDLPAATGVNSVDTIEQVVHAGPVAGKYLLAVRGATLANDTPFVLASSHPVVEDFAPVARIAPSATSGPPPLQVTFDGSSSSDPDGAIARYVWDFGDGATAEGALVQHTYGAGMFQAALTVYDNEGAPARTAVAIAVANQTPIAVVAATPDSGVPPLACLFSAAGSYDPDGAIVSYAWDFGDGTTGAGLDVSHTYAAHGLYFATLTVTDAAAATASRTVTVFVGQNATLASSRFRLNFRLAGNDRFVLTLANAPVNPDLVTPAGLAGIVRVGTAEYVYVLDERGGYNVPPLRVKLVAKRQRMTINLSRTGLTDALAPSGATSRDVKNALVRIPFALTLQDAMAGSPGLPYNYTARQGSSGSGRWIAP